MVKVDAPCTFPPDSMSRYAAPTMRQKLMPEFNLQRKDFDAVIDGMAMDAAAGHPRSGLGDARPLLRPGRERRRAAFGAHFRPAGRAAARRSPIISAARCSSPTSCATSTRTRAIGRLYLPREALAAAGVTTDDPLEAARGPEARCGLRRGGRARAPAFREGRNRSWTSAPRAAVRAPRLMAAAYGSILDRMVAEGFAPPRQARESEPPARARRASALRRPVSAARCPCHRRGHRGPERRRAPCRGRA